ncbi:MAG: nitroreductase family protein [Acidimicrobiales bacterium]
MELSDAVRRRRMVRAFEARAVPVDVVDHLIDQARRAPSAGNTQPWAFMVLEGEQTARMWDVSLPDDRRGKFRWQGLLDAPVVILPLVSPDAYVARYAEPDKVGSELGRAADAWPVPYWWVDGGMAVQTLLVGAVDVGLGALFFGLFDHERQVLDALGVPSGWRALGAVALGWPAPDEPGESAARPRPSLAEIVHRGRW